MVIDPNDPLIQRLLSETNAERAAHGLAPLTLNLELCSAAMWKAKDQVGLSLDHTDTLGREIGQRALDFGYMWSQCGENIASGQLSPEQVVQGWMHSPGHRANILTAEFIEIGFGYFQPHTNSQAREWVQLFGTPMVQPSAVAVLPDLPEQIQPKIPLDVKRPLGASLPLDQEVKGVRLTESGSSQPESPASIYTPKRLERGGDAKSPQYVPKRPKKSR